MRIVCQKCSAAYAIDDKFVTPKGVRAQCPRCRNLQLVKREDAAPAAEAPAPAPVAAPAAVPAPMGLDFASLPASVPAAPSAAPAAAPAAASSPFAFDFGAPASAPGPEAAAVPFGSSTDSSPFDFSAATRPAVPQNLAFDMEVPPSTSHRRPASVMPEPLPAPAPAPSRVPPPAASPAAPRARAPEPAPAVDDPFDLGLPASAPPTPSAPAPAADLPKCKSCGVDLSDPFDQALGTCDDCRNKQAASVSGSSGEGRVERIDRIERIASIDLSGTAPAPPTASPSAPSAPSDGKSVRSAMREGGSRSMGGVAILGAFLAAAAIGGYLIVKKPWKSKVLPPLVTSAKTAPPEAVMKVIDSWRPKYLIDEGKESDAVGYVSSGEASLLTDTTSGYEEAEESFQKALILDPTNEAAVAGWAFALAFGRAEQIDDPTLRAAQTLLINAEKRTGNPRLYVAHAHLMIATGGNPNDVRMFAERGKASKVAEEKALAIMALGQAQLATNPKAATDSFAEAQKLAPNLKRGYFMRAMLAQSLGHYKLAVDNLEERLRSDANQVEASEALARIYVEIGEVPKAKKVLDAAVATAKSGQVKVLHAMLLLQHANDLNGAVAELNDVIKTDGKAEQSAAYVQLSAAQRQQGDLDAAKLSAEAATALRPDSVPGHVQLFFALADKGVVSQARLEFDGLKGKLGDANLELALEGRLLYAEGRFDEAITALSKAADQDPRRVDALLLAGAAAAKARKDGKAWEMCLKRSLHADPFTYPVPVLASLYVRPADLIRPGIGAYTTLANGNGDDPNPVLCEGLMAWHSEQYSRANDLFSKVNSIDNNNTDAMAMRSLLALRKGEIGTAASLAGRATGLQRTNGLAHLAAGLANLQANKIEPAKLELEASRKYTPSLNSLKVNLADLEARLGSKEEAAKMLNVVSLDDPLYRDTKRVLYKHGL